MLDIILGVLLYVLVISSAILGWQYRDGLWGNCWLCDMEEGDLND